MALGSTQPLTEMSTRNIPGGERRPARKADNLTAVYEPIVYKMWEPQHLTALWVSMTRYRDSFTFTICILLRSQLLPYGTSNREMSWPGREPRVRGSRSNNFVGVISARGTILPLPFFFLGRTVWGNKGETN
jgi:hypothetical protein